MKNKIVRNMLIPGVCGVLAVIIPAVLIHFSIIDAYSAQIITLAGINAIMAISVNIICGITGQLSLGQAGFMAVGAYTTIWLTQVAHLPLPLSIAAGGLMAAFMGFLIGFPTLKLSGDYLAIVTLGFGEILRVVFLTLTTITGGSNGVSFASPVGYNPLYSYIMIICILIGIIVLVQNFIRSTYGRAIIAVRDDEIAAD